MHDPLIVLVVFSLYSNEYEYETPKQAGKDGGFILAPSDHFFDAEIELIRAFADEARKCIYL